MKPTKFKKGDKVVCIDNGGAPYAFAFSVGGEYVVSHTDPNEGFKEGDLVWCDNGAAMFACRFKLADPKPAPASKPAWESLGSIFGELTARLVVPGGTFYRIAGQTYLVLDRDAA